MMCDASTEMGTQADDDVTRKRFLWGTVLAWIPIPVFIFPMIANAISARKATGLGAVAGGLSEAFLTFGLAVTLVSEVAAIVFLLRAFSKGHPIRGFFTIFFICCSSLVLFFLGWLFLVRLHHS
jgi:hypothetical protein